MVDNSKYVLFKGAHFLREDSSSHAINSQTCERDNNIKAKRSDTKLERALGIRESFSHFRLLKLDYTSMYGVNGKRGQVSRGTQGIKVGRHVTLEPFK